MLIYFTECFVKLLMRLICVRSLNPFLTVIYWDNVFRVWQRIDGQIEQLDPPLSSGI